MSYLRTLLPPGDEDIVVVTFQKLYCFTSHIQVCDPSGIDFGMQVGDLS